MHPYNYVHLVLIVQQGTTEISIEYSKWYLTHFQKSPWVPFHIVNKTMLSYSCRNHLYSPQFLPQQTWLLYTPRRRLASLYLLVISYLEESHITSSLIVIREAKITQVLKFTLPLLKFAYAQFVQHRYTAYHTDIQTQLQNYLLFIVTPIRSSLVLGYLIDIISRNDSIIHFNPRFQFSTLFNIKTQLRFKGYLDLEKNASNFLRGKTFCFPLS